MEGINKLRAMQMWFDSQSEHFNGRFKTVAQMEKVFEYSRKNNLSYMDDDYLYGGEVTEKERIKVSKFLDKLI